MVRVGVGPVGLGGAASRNDAALLFFALQTADCPADYEDRDRARALLAVGRGGNELHVGVRFKKRLEAMRIQSIELPIAITNDGLRFR